MGVYTKEPFLGVLARERLPIIFEVGSRDGRDALRLQKTYGPDLLCVFEPNPEAIELVKSRLAGRAGIRFFEFACWHETARIPFYPVVLSLRAGNELERNLGASSCFLDAHTYTERLVQSEIEVDAIRLDDLMKREGISDIDLLCMDVQGAALNVLRGLGDNIVSVRWILTEAETRIMYRGEALLDEIEAHLSAAGFERNVFTTENEFFGDYLFRNTRHPQPR